MEKKTLEERMQLMEDVHAIENLMGRYEFLHTAGQHQETADMFAKKTPGVRAEILNWGVYEGTEGIQRFFVGVHSASAQDPRGVLNIHIINTQVIEVAGDGKTAKGVWMSPGIETMKGDDGKPQAAWAWYKYAIDFVKEDGQWKFWHFRVYGIFYTPYNQSWAEGENPAIMNVSSFFPKELKADAPSSPGADWIYSPTAIYPKDQPVLPDPYETWDETKAY